MGVQRKAKAPGRTYQRGTLAVAIGRGLASKVLASAVLLAPMASQAADECGASKQCTAAGNPYPNGIVYGTSSSVTLQSGVIVAPSSVATSHVAGISFGVATAWNTASRTGTTSGTIEAGASVTSDLDGIVGAALRDHNLQFTNHGDIVLTGANTQGVVLSPYTDSFPTLNFTNTGTISAAHAVSLGWGRSGSLDITASNSGSIRATTSTAIDFGVPPPPSPQSRLLCCHYLHQYRDNRFRAELGCIRQSRNGDGQ